MASASERSSRDGSRLWRHRTLSIPLPPTSQAICPPPTSQGLPPAPTLQVLPPPPTLQYIAPSSSPQASTSSVPGPSAPSWGRGTGRRGPTRGVTERRLLDGEQWNVYLVRGYGMGPTADHFTSRIGVVSKMYCNIWQKDFAKLPVATKELIFRDLQHFNGKSLDDAIASVPAGVDSSDCKQCARCGLLQMSGVVDRNKQNRATQSMPYRRGRTSHYQLMNDFSHMHGCTPHRLEVFKMGRCKDLLDDNESWVDEESRRRYEAMTQMIAPSSDIDAESHTPATPEDAFISVMGKDRPSRVRCVGIGETLGTWYRSIGTSVSSERERIMQEQLKAQEEKLKAQEEEMTQMREKISRLENVAMKVDEMSVLLSQIQASQARTQHVPPAVQSGSDSETDEVVDDYSDHEDHVS
ncbi:hypothetical protein Taro_049410 [Colocasia esculenta]|uniref:Uncharacterized protein n=1 Tax=Colocasia esculenta TaxID=4460 RepID=A0A843XAX3_COLES|nr:hypothetical protein [Colocasia esculenta]